MPDAVQCTGIQTHLDLHATNRVQVFGSGGQPNDGDKISMIIELGVSEVFNHTVPGGFVGYL